LPFSRGKNIRNYCTSHLLSVSELVVELAPASVEAWEEAWEAKSVSELVVELAPASVEAWEETWEETWAEAWEAKSALTSVEEAWAEAWEAKSALALADSTVQEIKAK